MGPEECVTAEDALRAVTVDAARQYGEADKGVIRPGMRADFVILSGDPLEVPAQALRDLRVEETIREGRTIWRREGPETPGVFSAEEAETPEENRHDAGCIPDERL